MHTQRRLILLALVLFCIPLSTLAEDVVLPETTVLQVQGLAVTPFIIDTEVNPGQEQLQYITLFNTTDAPLPIDLSINDFVVNDIDGQAIFLSSDQVSSNKYSLSKWIRIVEQPSFVIPPRGQSKVVFAILTPPDAEPGTHYGGLLFSYRPQGLPDGNVSVTQKVGVLVLARSGSADQRAKITRLQALPNLDSSSINFLLSFYNQGNVHLKPKGEIYLDNMFGHQVGSVSVNRDASIVLPESSRNFEASWKTGWRFGRYSATAVLYFGNPKIELRETIHFWIIPWTRLGFVFLLTIIFTFLAYKGIKKYNKWLVSRSR